MPELPRHAPHLSSHPRNQCVHMHGLRVHLDGDEVRRKRPTPDPKYPLKGFRVIEETTPDDWWKATIVLACPVCACLHAFPESSRIGQAKEFTCAGCGDLVVVLYADEMPPGSVAWTIG